MPGSDNFRPAATWERLQLRAALLRRVREFFQERDFLEVETPLLSADIVIDRHLEPLRTTLYDDPLRPDDGRHLWLQTSPEFAMKRLLAAGGQALYQITRAFRATENGPLHNPEFTLVEWYRVGDSMQQGMILLSELVDVLLQTGSAERISYAEAFEEFVGLDPHRSSLDQLKNSATKHHIQLPAVLHSDRDAWLQRLLTELVEPQLGQSGATILFDYPATQAALARIRSGDVPVAERFELYVNGIELANGYHELTDPQELLEREKLAQQQRIDEGKRSLPSNHRLLAAMQNGLPACTGVALGFDRVVMLACGAKHIEEVLAFPIDRA